MKLQKFLDEVCGKDHKKNKKKTDEGSYKLMFGGLHLTDNILDEITVEEIQEVIYSNLPKEKINRASAMKEFDNLLRVKVNDARKIAKKVVPNVADDLVDNVLEGKENVDDEWYDPKAYEMATKKIHEAWMKYQRIYMDEQMNIFANKSGKTASKEFIKLRDRIAVAHTTYENLITKHYVMAKKLK